METKHYFSLVSDRISELKTRLNELTELIDDLEYEDNKNLLERYKLELEFVKGKIKYLSEIEQLPLYISISSLSKADIIEMETKKNISFGELLGKLHIDKVASIVNKKKVVTLSYLKEAFMDDYDAILDLINMQNVNFVCSSKIRELYNSNEKSMQQLGIAEKRLNRVQDKVNSDISKVSRDYDVVTIKEIKKYINNPNDKLSKEFILKHKDKILEMDPSMEKTINKLTRKDKFSFITKFLPKKRNKNEQKCLDKIVESYKNDTKLESLGIETNVDLFEMNGNKLKKFMKKLDKAINNKRQELKNVRDNINSTREVTLSEIKKLDLVKEDKKKKFISLIHSKCNFIPKMFEDQLWNEPDLKNSLIKVACLQEEKMLVQKLSDWQPNINEDIEYLEEEHSRKLTA